MGINHANGAFKIYYALKPANTQSSINLFMCLQLFLHGVELVPSLVLNGFRFGSVWAKYG